MTRFDLFEAQLVKLVAERGLDPPEPVPFQRCELWLREPLLAGEVARVFDLDGAERPVVGKAVDPPKGEPGKALVQGLHDRRGPLADVRWGWWRGPSAGQALKLDGTERDSPAVDRDGRVRQAPDRRPVAVPEVAHLERSSFPVDQHRRRGPIDLYRARGRAGPVPRGLGVAARRG